MTKTELSDLIANGENSGVEFKGDVIAGHELAKELVAFANGWGGRVLLGVDDDGSIRGLAKHNPPTRSEMHDAGPRAYQWLYQWVMQVCRDKIHPEIVPYFEILRDVLPDRDIAVVQVARGWNIHHVRDIQHRTCYIRLGSSSREASPEKLARLFPLRGALRPELRPVSGTSMADLDRRRLTDYFDQVRGQDTPAARPPEEWRESTWECPGRSFVE